MILVTGATGTTGRELVAALRAKNAKFTALVRRQDAADMLTRDGIDVRMADLAEAGSLGRALAGIETAFLLSPGAPDLPRLQGQFIQAAKQAGVQRIVKMSAIGAHALHPCGFLRWNGVAETMLMTSGMSWTMLRPTGFLQNIGSLCAGMVKKTGGIYLPAGDCRIPMIDTRDIAAAAAAVLTESGHENRVYDLTGPELLTHHDVADTLTALLGRDVSYHPVGDVDAWNAMRKNGLPDAMCHAVLALWQCYRREESAFVSGWVEILTGRKPAGLKDYLTENIGLFRD